MFTGIIEEIGTVAVISALSNGLEITIQSQNISKKLQTGDSISIDGACQTVTEVKKDSFTVQAVGETLAKSTLGHFNLGRLVNLETSLTLSTPLGGHMIQGHVQGVTPIQKWLKRGEYYYLEVAIPDHLIKYCIAEGSIAIDGISLTIARLFEGAIGLNIIPFTVKNTTLHSKQAGELVNIETDMIARLVERLLLKGKEEGLNWEKIRNWGY